MPQIQRIVTEQYIRANQYNPRHQRSNLYQSMKYEDKTKRIIQAFYKVYNTLGFGFLEKVYQNSLYLELQKAGFHCEAQKPIKVYYDDHKVGDYYADIVVDNSIILELKAMEALCEEHEFQLINYLKATEIEIGLLLNFGKKPEFKRKIFSNDRKTIAHSYNG